ncbi:MAG: hypothetical protein JJLCMIEE_03058 [Acidimicrobiales bacterium]|nr:MAG: hypothetical protein EDR02_07910 [Actinomycetota bacterium]MBV6509942.1 hypothetical protein [Acidimicrobiales bacterium]RIK08568.1 MAG: hypothetical protein DCC48_01095 [Acidobacteriota bacterium]
MSGSDYGGTSSQDVPGGAGLSGAGPGRRAGNHLEWVDGDDADGWVSASPTPGRRSQGGRSYRAPLVIPESEISVSGWAVISVVVAAVSDLASMLLAVAVLAGDDATGWSPTGGWTMTQGWLSVLLGAAVLLISGGAMLIGRKALRQIGAARGRKRGAAWVRAAYALALLAIIGGLAVLGAHLLENPPELHE